MKNGVWEQFFQVGHQLQWEMPVQQPQGDLRQGMPPGGSHKRPRGIGHLRHCPRESLPPAGRTPEEGARAESGANFHLRTSLATVVSATDGGFLSSTTGCAPWHSGGGTPPISAWRVQGAWESAGCMESAGCLARAGPGLNSGPGTDLGRWQMPAGGRGAPAPASRRSPRPMPPDSPPGRWGRGQPEAGDSTC